MSTPLKVMQQLDLSEQINELVDYPDDVESAPYEVIVECARRYLENLAHRKARKGVRYSEQVMSARRDAREKLKAEIYQITADIADALVESWTPEVLASSFPLPDGEMVKWSEATVKQHEARAQQLERMARGSIETARLHRRAIYDISEAAVKSLGEL